jgi:hypothetical protein
METVFYKIGSTEYIFEQSINKNKRYDIKLFTKSDNKILWEIYFKSIVEVKLKGLYGIKNELFCFINGSVNKIDINNGSIIKKNNFGNTSIITFISDNNNMYILLDYYEFDVKKYISNFLCINNNLDIKWHAELLNKEDIYSGLGKTGKDIIGYTWNGWKCTINKDTGKIVDTLFTK